MKLMQGDCVEAMRSMPEASVDSIVCDPPYLIGFMSKDFDKQNGAHSEPQKAQAWHEAWAREALRVLKPGGFLLASGGTRTAHRLTCAIEDAGFEIRDSITWIYGSGFPKSKSMKDIDRPELGTALKPAHEPIAMARKPLSEKSVARNVLEHGTGALNIDESRIGNGNDRVSGGNSHGANSYNGYGAGVERPSGGRWPANVILSHSPECQRVGVKRVRGDGHWTHKRDIGDGNIYSPGGRQELDEGNKAADPDGFEEVEAWECVDGCPVAEIDRQSGNSKSTGGGMKRSGSGNNVYSKQQGHPQVKNVGHGDQGGASRFFKTFEGEQDGMSEPSVCTHPDCTVELHLADRCLGTKGAQVAFEGEPGFFYCAKSSRRERNAGLEGMPKVETRGNYGDGIQDNRPHTREGYEYRSTTANHHPTVKPLALMRYLVKLVTPPGGVVLDPFAGSGSTLVAAIQEGFDAVGIEQDTSYIEIAERRVAHALEEQEQKPLLLEV